MSEEQEESLKCLEEFIDFAYSELGQVNIRSHFKRKKTVLLFMYVNACDIASNSLLLLKEERVNAAQSMLRSLQEAWINTQFITINGDYRWVDSYLLESELEITKFARNIKSIREKYPSVNTGGYEIEKIEKIISDRRKFVAYAEKRYSEKYSIPDVSTNDIVKKPYNVRDKTIIIDKIRAENSNSDIKYSEEFNYITLYSHLSGGTHVGASYLASNLAKKDKTGITILKHGDKSNVQLYAWTTYALLLDISKLFGQHFKHPTATPLKKYQKIINGMRESIPTE